ncbi:hypothetical protein M011DRAFT_454887 [Sporormia fimetaria CBS 119925]|uniref:Uncharacterized protein n=1 Tax=Sporormia fimetaria CBS 119925 TaxID=1340428 RepID=A0A6A6VRZ7_9PLEO|nr:hypothetical protein M011DRAFT_454887 [Sporormia fimetaria CBS 119925]
MSAPRDELSLELPRILACAYPASLTTLADILGRADERVVRTSIRHLPPCATVRLASIVTQALSLWPYALHILHRLCLAPDFRRALLRESPALLDTLLTKACSSQRSYDEYAALCVRLLSRPLPEEVALPASAQSFFLRLFNDAVEQPDVGTLKPIYLCLNGACRGLLHLLSIEDQRSFDEELCRILSKSAHKDFMLTLWCFGIVILAEHPHDVGKNLDVEAITGTTSDLAPHQTWKTASGRKLFSSTKGLQKTIHLTYLSVVCAVGDTTASEADVIEGIKIGVRTMQFIDRSMREAYPRSSDVARQMVPKLIAKALRDGVPSSVQLGALSFYATVVGTEGLPTEALEGYEAAILESDRILPGKNFLRETLLFTLPTFAPKMDSTALRRILFKVLDTGASCEKPLVLSNISILVESLTTVIPTSPALSSQISIALSSPDLQRAIQTILDVASKIQSFKEQFSCAGSDSLLRRDIISQMISMLLTSILTSPSGQSQIPRPVATALINAQQNLTKVPITVHCNHRKADVRTTVPLFEQQCTPSTGAYQRDWRGLLTSELERQNVYQRESVLRSVAQICESLESRCNNVEEPLRREEEKVRSCKAEISQLREQVHTLGTEMTDLQQYTDGLETELGASNEDRDNISAKLADLKAEMAHAARQANETLRVAQEQHATLEEQLRSAIFTNEEEIHSLREELEMSNKRISDLEFQLEHEHGKFNSLRELHKTLTIKCDALQSGLDEERRAIADRENTIIELTTSAQTLEAQLSMARGNAEASISQLEELRNQHEELIRSSKQALEEVEIQHAAEVDGLKTSTNEEISGLRVQLDRLTKSRQEAQTAHEQCARDLHLMETRMQTLEHEVQTLTARCTRKSDELQQLKRWKRQVFESVPISAETPIPARKGREPVPSSNYRTSRTRKFDDLTTSHTARIDEDGVDAAFEEVAEASFGSSDSYHAIDASTPKRRKPRPSEKANDMYTPACHTTVRSSHRRRSSKRLALGDVSPNRRHTTVGSAVPSSETDHCKERTTRRGGSLHVRERTSWGAEQLSPGMPFTPDNVMSGTGRHMDAESLYDQTTDF